MFLFCFCLSEIDWNELEFIIVLSITWLSLFFKPAFMLTDFMIISNVHELLN